MAYAMEIFVSSLEYVRSKFPGLNPIQAVTEKSYCWRLKEYLIAYRKKIKEKIKNGNKNTNISVGNVFKNYHHKNQANKHPTCLFCSVWLISQLWHKNIKYISCSDDTS